MSLPTAAPPLHRNRDFRLFWLSQTISKFGDPITLIGLAAITYQMTESALLTSIAVLVATLPQATFGFFAGPISDALGHRRVMIGADLLRALLIGLMPLVYMAGLPLVVPFGLVFLSGLCSAVFLPARGAIIPTLVRGDQLVAANSSVYATDRAVEIIGTVAGGLLVATLGVGVFYIDALTFLVSAVLMLLVAVRDGPARSLTAHAAVTDALDGLRIIRRSAVLFANTTFALIAQLCIPVLTALLPVYVFRRFADGDPALGAALFGLAEGAIAAGAVLGSIGIVQLTRSVRKGSLLVWGFGACGLSLMVAAVVPSFELLIPVLVATGVANVLFFVPNSAIVQEHAPAAARGSVIGARISLLHATWVPVGLAFGALADRVDAGLLIGVAGLFTFVVALVGSRFPAVSGVR